MRHANSKPIILSADDDENAHVLLTRAFIKAGVTVTFSNVHNGEETIQYLAGENQFADRQSFPMPDLVLLDLKMPQKNGFDVLNFILTRPELKALPVVVFSSSDAEVDRVKAYELGCHSYVVKPTDFERLVQFAKAIEDEFFYPRRNGRSGEMFSQFAIPPKNDMPKREIRPVVEPEPAPQVTSPEIFRLLVEQVKDYAIFMLDKEGRILSWNEGARRIKGYEAEEIIGKHFSVFYRQQDKDNRKPQFELTKALEMGRYEDESWRLRKDGSRFWANVVVTPMHDGRGKLLGFAKVTRDLTQRKLQEEDFQNLLESEERYRLLVDQVKDYAIFLLDAKGNINSWNQGARRLKGYTADEILGKHFSLFYTAEDIKRDHPAKELALAIREGRYEEEGWRVRKDGSRFWANVVITSLWDKRGNLTGFAKVTKDLTQRKKEEDALRQKTTELESFAHTLSHDLRAPLRSISSFSQILMTESKQISEEDRVLYAEKIFRSAQLMDTLIRDILKLSELSLAPFSEESVSLEKVVGECLALLDSDVRKANAQITIKKPLPTVKANRTLLVQLFINLLSNAIKFVEPGRNPKIEVYAAEQNGECEIHVKDNGVGIPEEHFGTIFRVFERGHTLEGVSGTGIGLAVVKKVVDRIGGRISIKSKAGAGSDFIVTLPCELPIARAMAHKF